jgi:hypothetical protein
MEKEFLSYKEAKEIEKQQIIDAYEAKSGYQIKNGEDYYNKKFNK